MIQLIINFLLHNETLVKLCRLQSVVLAIRKFSDRHAGKSIEWPVDTHNAASMVNDSQTYGVSVICGALLCLVLLI